MKMKNVKTRILACFISMLMLLTVWLPATTVKAEITLPAATNISFDKASSLDFDTNISEDVSEGDNVRYYKFNLKTSCELIVRGECEHYNKSNSKFVVYDETRTEVYRFGVGNGFSESFYLTGGQYYLKYESMHDVSFLVTKNTLSESFKETQTQNNDMISGASAITVRKSYKGVLTSNDEIDYYKFNVPANGTVNFSITNPSDYGMYYKVYNKSLGLVYKAEVSSGRKLSEYVKLNKGDYYLAISKIFSNEKGGSYKFAIDYAPNEPAKPTIKSVKNSSSKAMKLTWKKVSNISGYQIQYSTDKKFKKNVTSKTVAASKTNATYKKLSKGKTYYVRMRAYVTVNGTKTYGDWSSKLSVKIIK